MRKTKEHIKELTSGYMATSVTVTLNCHYWLRSVLINPVNYTVYYYQLLQTYAMQCID